MPLPLVEKGLNGDIRAIARLISEVENETDRADQIMKEIYSHTGRAHLIGITGSPGAGKSTLTNKLITSYRAQGKKVGVVAVDPSSPFSGGAILADRIRMQEHSGDSGVYIRSMGSRGSLGGLSRSTYEGALILDACGYDVVIVETVGVGQSEIDIVRVADTVCLILVPGMGDDMQIMKAGIMEIADLFVINKADRDGTDRLAGEIRLMLKMFGGSSEWEQPLHMTVAQNGTGVDELVEGIESHRRFLEGSKTGLKRRELRVQWETEEIMRRKIAALVEKEGKGFMQDGDAAEKLRSRRIDPYTVSASLLARILK